MSQETEQFTAAVAPVENMTRGGQIGPNIQGSGIAEFAVTANTFYLFFDQSGNSAVSYGVDGGFLDTQLQPNTWTTISGATIVNVKYVANGGDLKLIWAQ